MNFLRFPHLGKRTNNMTEQQALDLAQKRKGRWSAVDQARLRTMVDNAFPAMAIANALGRSVKSVDKAKDEYLSEKAARTPANRKRWTNADIIHMQRSLKSGMSQAAVARQMGRSKRAISMRVYKQKIKGEKDQIDVMRRKRQAEIVEAQAQSNRMETFSEPVDLPEPKPIIADFTPPPEKKTDAAAWILAIVVIVAIAIAFAVSSN